jgi:hypothetical protein
MRKLLVFCGAMLCLTLPAAAQEISAVPDAASPASETMNTSWLTPADRDPWQLTVGFQYSNFGVLPQRFSSYGYTLDIARYLNKQVALEGLGSFGFGGEPVPPNGHTVSLFAGGGPHISFGNTDRWEPWAHVLVGVQHFRATQGAVFGNNTHLAFMAGGGADYKFAPRAFWRFQVDFVGSKFALGKSSFDKSISIGTGLVLNF